jgi:hypothetical protein
MGMPGIAEIVILLAIVFLIAVIPISIVAAIVFFVTKAGKK